MQPPKKTLSRDCRGGFADFQLERRYYRGVENYSRPSKTSYPGEGERERWSPRATPVRFLTIPQTFSTNLTGHLCASVRRGGLPTNKRNVLSVPLVSLSRDTIFFFFAQPFAVVCLVIFLTLLVCRTVYHSNYLQTQHTILYIIYCHKHISIRRLSLYFNTKSQIFESDLHDFYSGDSEQTGNGSVFLFSLTKTNFITIVFG